MYDTRRYRAARRRLGWHDLRRLRRSWTSVTPTVHPPRPPGKQDGSVKCTDTETELAIRSTAVHGRPPLS